MARIDTFDTIFALDRQGPELVDLADKKKLDFTYERPELLARLSVLLAEKSVLLVGEEGVGKRSLVRMLAHRLLHLRRMEEAEKPPVTAASFPYRLLYSTDGFVLVTVAHYEGELAEKIHRVAREAAEKHAILFINNIEMATGSGVSSDSPLASLANIIASCLESNADFRIIGATTPAGQEILRTDARALASQLGVLDVPPVRRSELGPWFQRYEDHLASRTPVKFAPGFVSEVLDASDRFHPSRALPGKAIEMVRSIQQEHRTMEQVGFRKPGDAPPVLVLEPGFVHEHIAKISGLSQQMIESKPVPRAVIDAGVRAFFEARIIGQPAAVDAGVSVVVRYRARLVHPGKPISVMLLAGCTGVGKTEFAKVVAEFFFGSADRLLRYDMSEFQTSEHVARLFGAPRGERRAPEPSLVDRVRSQPFCVLLFDEVEKAEPRFLDFFLQLFDEARLTGTDGKVAHFTNSIILLTTNLGTELFESVGFMESTGQLPSPDALRRHLEKKWRPELVNRIDQVILFGKLARADLERILEKEMTALRRIPGLQSVRAIRLSAEVLDAVLHDGYQPRYGARPLKRSIDKHVLVPLSYLLSTTAVSPNDELAVDTSGASVADAGSGMAEGWTRFTLASG